VSLALPLLVFSALYGPLYLPAWPVAHAATEVPLTVMSFNVWGGSQAPETARVILDHDTPDVIALQELTPHVADLLLEELGDAYPYHAIETRGQYHGLGVLSRYPLAKLEASHLLHPGWRIQIVRVEARGSAFTLYNVHPYSTNVILYLETGAPIAERVQASVGARQELIRRLAADATGRPGPIIVAGDLNSTDQSEAYAILASHLTDAHRAVGWGFGHTFPAYTGRYRGIPILPRQMRIDMIFASEELVPLRSRVSETHGESDHLPVLAEFGWR
jgi:endonuclease/exonuclease/phosphatase (EEP) superfamily protein YafD